LLRTFLGFIFLFCAFPVFADLPIIKIGVLSHRGDITTLQLWSPTADYLNRQVPEYTFSIVPLDFDEIDSAVSQKKIDFLLVNPGIYVKMEVMHRISRIATLNNLMENQTFNKFGGVIFTAKSNQEINTLDDLRGHSFMAVDRTSLGGFQMAWREIKSADIDISVDLSELQFGGTHDEVVKAVVKGKVDAGTVRSGILKSMSDEGLINLENIKIIHKEMNDSFPFLHSTRLYPEWPFSKLLHTPNDLAQRVTVALLEMSEIDPAAQWGEYAGWTIPLEYQPVHDLLKELSLSPYDQIKGFTLTDVISRYFVWIIVVAFFIFTLTVMVIFIYHLHRKLEESKHLLEQAHVQILDSVADGIYGVDMNGNSTFVNKAMENITGWKSSELIGRNQHELLHHTRSDGSHHPAEECPVFKTFVDNKARFIEEDLFWRKDGTSFPVEYSSNPVKNEQGNTVGGVVVFRDISLKKQSQEAAQQYQLELAHVARLSTMGEMASGLAHELNQPLTAIAINADACANLIESKASENKLIDIVDKIGLQARRAGEMIQHLRKFVRKEKPEFSPLDVNKLIDEVLLLIKTDISKANVTLNLNLEKDLPLVMAQHIHIDQVLLNLIRNALEAMCLDDDSDIRTLSITTLSMDQANILVRVQDTGPGISEDILQKLFIPFMTSKKSGIGLGLSLSQGIIEAHQGKLFLESTSSQGAIFCFSLPMVSEVKND